MIRDIGQYNTGYLVSDNCENNPVDNTIQYRTLSLLQLELTEKGRRASRKKRWIEKQSEEQKEPNKRRAL